MMDEFFANRSINLDEITRVYNKTDMFDYARHLITLKKPFSLIYVDIDNSKFINDVYGFEALNKVLFRVAQCLYDKTGEKGAVGRIEGDKFVVVLKEITSYDEIWTFCHELLVDSNELKFEECEGLSLTLTVGLSRFPDNGMSLADLDEASEKALYRGKTKGRNCFIIYVPEKHENIVVKSNEDKAMSTTNLHSTVFKFLSTDDLKTGITNLFNFLSSYFELDHICIQSNGMLLYQKIHQLSKTQKFDAIPVGLIKSTINQSTDMYYINDAKILLQTRQIKLFEELAKQNITSTCYFDISYNGQSFGMLRADMTGTGKDIRIWQYADLDILLTCAKTLAIILHYSGRQISSL